MIEQIFKLKGVDFKPPVFLASGTAGNGIELLGLTDFSFVGAVVTKAVTINPRSGNPPPRLAFSAQGLINSIGLANPGLEVFIKEIMPSLENFPAKIVINVAGEEIEDYVGVIKALSEFGNISGFEVNISCPNVKKGGISFGKDPLSAQKLVESVRKATEKPLILKLSPHGDAWETIAVEAEKIGVDAFSFVNTYPALVFDAAKRRFALGNKTGGLSGPAIKPLALFAVYSLRKLTSLPIIGGGGIVDYKDAVEFFLAGADAISVGTALFSDPDSPKVIFDGLKKYCLKHGLNSFNEIKLKDEKN
ncbi:dihydroorotate dehydrogenase, partial [candidate division WOR-3 bacterium]|nr:dihydroorotate dehydrogenase [candidate division WOR-3 bacterium]